jgi:hypothetical protein
MYRPETKIREEVEIKCNKPYQTDPVSETPCSLEYWTIDKVQKPVNPDFHTPSSEHF